jgi:hypothetical protein
MAPRNPWKTLSSRTAYQNEWLRVREDGVLRPDGNPGIYGVVEIRPSVGILAFNAAGEIALVGQWRYTIERYSWEIVRGGCVHSARGGCERQAAMPPPVAASRRRPRRT